MSNIQKQHKISPAIAWLTIQKFIIFYCPLDGEHTIILGVVNLFITAVVSISKKKNARIELLDGTRIPAFIIGMLLILMSKLFSV